MQKLDFPSVQLNFSESVTETGSSEPLVPSAQFIRTRSERILLGLFLMSGDNYAYRQPCSYYVMYWMKQGEWFWFRIRSTVTRPKYVQHPTNPGITSHVLDQIHQHTPMRTHPSLYDYWWAFSLTMQKCAIDVGHIQRRMPSGISPSSA